MIVVALVGLVLGGVAMATRASQYRRLAATYRFLEDANSGKRVAIGSGEWIQTDAVSPEWAAYYAEMRRKYERAARLPILPVSADPPKPKGSPSVIITFPE
jgi:hypothetical protein